MLPRLEWMNVTASIRYLRQVYSAAGYHRNSLVIVGFRSGREGVRVKYHAYLAQEKPQLNL